MTALIVHSSGLQISLTLLAWASQNSNPTPKQPSRKAERKYMQRPKNLKVGDKFRVIRGNDYFDKGEIITLKEDDGTDCPFFWKEDEFNYYGIYFSKLEPYVKSIRDAQVGDVVVEHNSGYERMVLERLQNIVILSHGNNFRTIGPIYTFDDLEVGYTLKDTPEVVDDKTAEAIKLLKEAGYKITKD